MDISHRMVIPSLLFVLFIIHLGEGHNSSPKIRCGEDGPVIQFPFQLKDQHSGCPGFDLYCNDKNDTVLELPTSVKVFVKQIDYKSHLINVTDSDNCFPRKIPRLHLSSPPFQFKRSLHNFSLFNYTPYTESDYLVPCLSSSSTSVFAFPSDRDINDLPILSGTKMYSVSSVPVGIWDSPFLELTWSEPKCGDKGIVLFLSNIHFYNHASSVSCQRILILSSLVYKWSATVNS